ncbi:MAG: hypothetical protein H0T42_29055 [Deltaproteobacteria bacterium]|nr:hypothetical protein [Deltaproteobacteria bacterium]
MNHALLAAVIATVVVIPQVAAADKLKVAVIPGIAVNLDAARVDALSQDLADALQVELDIEAIGGLEVRRALPAEGIPPDCVATPACATDVAKRVGASQLLFVVMVDTGTGGSIQVDTTWVEPSTGKSASRAAIDLASLADAKARFITAAPSLLPDAPVRAKPKTGGFGGMMAPAVPRHVSTPAKVTGVLAVVGIGLGIGFGLKARSGYKSCDEDRLACSDGDRDSIRTSGLIADASFLVGVGAAIATTVLYVTSGKEAHLVVEPSPQGAAVAVIGRF